MSNTSVYYLRIDILRTITIQVVLTTATPCSDATSRITTIYVDMLSGTGES